MARLSTKLRLSTVHAHILDTIASATAAATSPTASAPAPALAVFALLTKSIAALLRLALGKLRWLLPAIVALTW